MLNVAKETEEVLWENKVMALYMVPITLIGRMCADFMKKFLYGQTDRQTDQTDQADRQSSPEGRREGGVKKGAHRKREGGGSKKK